MLKIFGFVLRNPELTHDEYRAGHVGYHNSYGRRLNNIRGYLLNVRANDPLNTKLDPGLLRKITRGEPERFDEQWDGWGQLLFDSMHDYVNARSPALDKPGPNGMEYDDKVAAVGGDFEHLYGGSPCQFHVDEHVALPVLRPERKLFKLAQFVQRPASLSPELFRAYWTGRYAQLAKTLPGLRGLVINLRSPLDVMTEFFPADAEGFTPSGVARRERFYAAWDGIAEYWFDGPESFQQGREQPATAEPLLALEQEIFANCFYREVDETVAVLPNRAPAPDFYHR